MPLLSVQVPNRPGKKRSIMDEIATGVDAASKILGTGIDAYKVFGVEAPEAQARGNYYQALANAQAGKQDYQAGKQDYQAFVKAKGDLEALRGNTALRNANEVLRLSENAKSIIKPYGDNLGNVPQDQVNLFDAELAKIATGGVPTEAAMHEISDPTLFKQFSALVSKVKNAPQGAGQAQFLPNKVRYLNDLQSNAANLIQKTYNRKLDDWKSHLNPDDYTALKQNMSDFLGNYQGTNMPTQTGANGQAAMAPASGPHGPSVIQGGHTFNWNPQTGNYE